MEDHRARRESVERAVDEVVLLAQAEMAAAATAAAAAREGELAAAEAERVYQETRDHWTRELEATLRRCEVERERAAMLEGDRGAVSERRRNVFVHRLQQAAIWAARTAIDGAGPAGGEQ